MIDNAMKSNRPHLGKSYETDYNSMSTCFSFTVCDLQGYFQ